MAGALLQIRNALAEGVDAIFSSVSLVLATLLGFGMPAVFWLTLLFWPIRSLWCRFRCPSPAIAKG
jgi:polyferredoxin